MADDQFAVDFVRGIVTTRGQLDREAKDFYTVPVYVTDNSATPTRSARRGGFNAASDDSSPPRHNDQFDVATIVVRVTDVNDHAPEFRLGSCYPLAVPENSETAVVHTVVATDLDDGANGEIAYSITGKLL